MSTTSPDDLRLGFVTARSAHVDANGIWVEAGVGRLLEIWNQMFGRFTVAMSHAPSRMPYHDHKLAISAAQFLPMPWLPSVARGFYKAWGCRSVIARVEQQSDVLLVQLPFAAPLALLGAKTPRVYHLCHDILGVARTSPLYRGVKRIPALAIGKVIDTLQRRMIEKPSSRLVANGPHLADCYAHSRGRAVVSATLFEKELLSFTRQRPMGAPFRVLYVGYIRPEKGIDTLLQAFESLIRDLPDAELHIVGVRNIVDHGMMAELEASLSEMSRKATVKLMGQINFGPELFQCFADADVLAVPSRAEGTPRVLIEARAFGCPVIGTTVGGIPSSIDHEVDGLLIPPDDPSALKAAMLRIARDPEFKAKLVAGGVQRARRHTVEAYARSIAEEVVLAYEGSDVVNSRLASKSTVESIKA